jgi:hypothetical protein
MFVNHGSTLKPSRHLGARFDRSTIKPGGTSDAIN